MAATLTFDSAYRQIKQGQFAPVYYLTGEEDVLKDELVHMLVEHAIDPGSRDFNLDVRQAGDLDGEAFHALVETPPMLAERRVVVIRNVEQWRKNARVWEVIERYVTNPSPTTVLVFTHAAGEKPHRVLAGGATQVALEPLSPDRVHRWVAARAKHLGITLSGEAAAYIVDAVGADLQLLGTELGKLAAVGGAQEMSVEQVAALVGVRRGETPHDWIAAVLARDVARAVGMLEGVLSASGVTAVRLLATLGAQLIGVRLAVELRAADSSGRQVERQVFDAIRRGRPYGLGDWKAEARSWVAAAERWTPVELNAALRAAYDADKALKSTTVSNDVGILSTMLLRSLPSRVAA